MIDSQYLDNTKTCTMLYSGSVWGTWESWTACSKTCGTGVQVRTKNVATLEEYGGKSCNGEKVSIEVCTDKPCPGKTYSFQNLEYNLLD